ncbi:MAG: rhomboid family intramembrane serine protease [Terriglobia bacterium]
MNYRYTTPRISFGGPLTPVVRNIIIACVAVFVMELIAGEPLAYFFSLTPALVFQKFYFWQLFTYLFLHDRHGIFHLLFNMLSLFMFGCEMERYWGSKRFFQFYCLTGIGAGLCVLAIPSNFYTSTIGASGAIYGVLLAYGLTFPDRIIYFFIFPLPARYFVLINAGLIFFTALYSSNSGISNAAHLGGMGFAYLYLKSQRKYRTRSPHGKFNSGRNIITAGNCGAPDASL